MRLLCCFAGILLLLLTEFMDELTAEQQAQGVPEDSLPSVKRWVAGLGGVMVPCAGTRKPDTCNAGEPSMCVCVCVRVQAG